MDEIIELTPQELEDIKETIKFRECVMIKLKALKGVPDRITKAEAKLFFLMWIIPIGLSILGLIVFLNGGVK